MLTWVTENLLSLVLAGFAGLGVVLAVHHRLKSIIEGFSTLQKHISGIGDSLEEHKDSFEDFKTKSLIIDDRHGIQIDHLQGQLNRHEDKCESDKKEIFRKIDGKADK